MDRILEIEKKVNEKRKQYYEGYGDILKYMSSFSKEELDYIEVTEKAGIESYKRLGEYKSIFPVITSLIALIFACVPEIIKNEMDFFLKAGMAVLLLICFILAMYNLVDSFSSKNVDIKLYILEIIKKVREQ